MFAFLRHLKTCKICNIKFSLSRSSKFKVFFISLGLSCNSDVDRPSPLAVNDRRIVVGPDQCRNLYARPWIRYLGSLHQLPAHVLSTCSASSFLSLCLPCDTPHEGERGAVCSDGWTWGDLWPRPQRFPPVFVADSGIQLKNIVWQV